MATVLPPPSKRQKRLAQSLSTTQHTPTPAPQGSVRLQFVDQSTGEPLASSIVVPLAQASAENLEVLVNDLQGNDDEEGGRVRYRFFLPGTGKEAKEGTGAAGVALPRNGDVYSAVVETGKASTEDTIVVQFAPEAVFRVKAVSRCSAAVAGHGEPILACSFSPRAGAGRVATGSGDGTARVWDAETGTPVWTLKGHSSWVLCVAWAPGEEWLATGSYDNTVRLWDPASGTAVGGSLKGHTKWITSLAWEPYHVQERGRPRLASSSKDGTVRIWDVINKRADMALTGHKGSVSCVKWGGTGLIYTSSHDKTVKVWDATTGKLLHDLKAHAHWVNHLALSTDHVLRTGYHDHTKSIPSTEEEKRAKAKERFEKAAKINGVIVERLATAGEDLSTYLWHPTGSTPTKPIARLTGHQKQVNHVTFSPDGAYIATAAWDNHIKLWAARDGTFISTLRGHVAPVYQVCFSPDSRLLLSGSKDCTLKTWDVRTGKIAVDLPGHEDEVYAVDWSPSDGLKCASGGKDKKVRIWMN